LVASPLNAVIPRFSAPVCVTIFDVIVDHSSQLGAFNTQRYSSAIDHHLRRVLQVALAVCLLTMVGCKSAEKNGSAGFASVVLSGNTPGQIRDAAVDVFGADGYTAAQKDPGNLIFEKKGGGMNNFAYGSWLADDPVWIRVKAAVVPAGDMTFRLQCSAFMVRDKGGVTEEEVRLTRIHRGRYQKLLDQVVKRFERK
jgi:hypothetical protein